MLGTILLIGMIVCGYQKVSAIILIPAAIAASFIGAHFPPGKANMLNEMGIYWNVVVTSIPLQAVLMAALYGIGLAARALFK